MTSGNEYTVQPGDTLSAIAQKNNVTVNDLIALNHIDNPRLIYPGQKLVLSQPDDDDNEAFFSEIWIRVIDANGMAIPDLKTTVVTSTNRYEHVTDKDGVVPPVKTQKQDEKIQVFIAKLDGGTKQVAELKPPAGIHQATLRSPKLKAEIPLRVHQGGPDHQESAPLPMAPGEIQHNRDTAGNPVVNAGVECPNKDNLRLDANGKYREFILTAAARSGIMCQGIAALISAEAGLMPAKIELVPLLSKDGKPLLDKAGKPRTRKRRIVSSEWNPDVANAIGAVGLTQFLKPAWLELAATPGTMLNDRCASLAEKSGAKDLSESEILKLRTDPELSIVSAADYAVGNIQKLGKRDFKVDDVTGMNRAKLGYFLHHEGVGGAASILNGTLSDAKADSNLAQQFRTKNSDGTAEAEAYRKKVGLNGAAAYKRFIFDYVDTKITPKYFSCDSNKIEVALTMEEISKKLK